MDQGARTEYWRWARDLVISVVILPLALELLKVSRPLIIVAAVLMLIAFKAWEHFPSVWKLRDRERKRKVLALGGMVLFGICFVGSAGYYFLWPADTAPIAPAVRSSLDQTIQLQCDWVQMPDTIPPDGWHEMAATTENGVNHMWTSLPGGSANNMKGPDSPDRVYRCRFTNFGPSPVVNVEADLTFEFRQVITMPNGTRSGAVIKTVVEKTPRKNLGIGNQSTSDFFVRNYSHTAYLQVILPKTVRVQAVGKSDWETATLIAATTGGFGLEPFTPKRRTNPADEK